MVKVSLILKASSGSQTGVGVIITESMRSLHITNVPISKTLCRFISSRVYKD